MSGGTVILTAGYSFFPVVWLIKPGSSQKAKTHESKAPFMKDIFKSWFG
jgi:hypothetical protein